MVMAKTPSETIALPVVGMTCAACQHHVESALRSTSGVESARVDLMAHRATIVFDPRLADAQLLIDAIRNAGYDSALPGPDHSSSESEADTKVAEKSQAVKAGVMIGSGIAAMLVSMPLDAHMGPFDRMVMGYLPWLYAIPPDLTRWVLMVATAVLLVWAGRPIFANAARSLKHGTSNMNTLVSLGTGVAFFYSAYATILSGHGRQVYFDAVLFILGFLLLGKVLEARAKRR